MKIIENGTVTSPIGFFGAGAHVGIKKEKTTPINIITGDKQRKTDI